MIKVNEINIAFICYPVCAAAAFTPHQRYFRLEKFPVHEI